MFITMIAFHCKRGTHAWIHDYTIALQKTKIHKQIGRVT